MAKPGELTHMLAQTTGISEATLALHNRNLALGGQRSKGGRGRSAPAMTARDAANLIIAAIASGHVKDSAETVQRYTGTTPDPEQSSTGLFAPLQLDELSALPPGHSFVDGLEALLRSAGDGALAARMREAAARHRAHKIVGAPHIEVAACLPETLGEIRISGLRGAPTVLVRYVPASMPMAGGHGSGGSTSAQARAPLAGDFQGRGRITEWTIIKIADLLLT